MKHEKSGATVPGEHAAARVAMDPAPAAAGREPVLQMAVLEPALAVAPVALAAVPGERPANVAAPGADPAVVREAAPAGKVGAEANGKAALEIQPPAPEVLLAREAVLVARALAEPWPVWPKS